MIRFSKEVCNDFAAAGSREWLETNGLGGFGSSTISGANTRRYHGLLFAATDPPVGRTCLLSKLEETHFVDDVPHDLSANQYPGVIHPQGYLLLESFVLDPFPKFIYSIGETILQKTIFMIYGEDSVCVEYKLLRRANDSEECRLSIRPLLAFRDFHSLARQNSDFNGRYNEEPSSLTFTPYPKMPALYLAHNAGYVIQTGNWYNDFVYEREKERGFDDREDLFNPCELSFTIGDHVPARLIASTTRHSVHDFDDYRSREIERRRTVVAPTRFNDPIARSLVSAADQFIVARGEQKTVIAGYHWFGDWGRDTMIALPGLTLLTGRVDAAQSILAEFAKHVDNGMLPNRFPDSGSTPEYNTVDATLWFFEAIRALVSYANDTSFLERNLYATLVNIIEWHIVGTRYGIKVDSDGLLSAGEPGVQLTWMDAKVGDHVITPRIGKPVEIQALWYNALCIMSEFANELNDQTHREQFGQMAESARQSFNEMFWNDESDCLYDVVGPDGPDKSIRPNQIFAVSLYHSLLDRDRATKVVSAVQRDLLTPYGLRSLAPADPAYVGRYQGGPVERDGAYHQGTVWSWLMGPFITAYVRVNEGSRESREQATKWLEPFAAHLSEAGLGQISEVFDGDAPHHPGGCIAQAWSVAEVLRALLEEAHHFGHRTWQTGPLQSSYQQKSLQQGG